MLIVGKGVLDVTVYHSVLCPVLYPVLLTDSITKIQGCLFSYHTNDFTEIVALKQLFPEIGSSPGFPLPLLSSAWRQKYVNKWTAVLVCPTAWLFSSLCVYIFSWWAKAQAIKGGASWQAHRDKYL